MPRPPVPDDDAALRWDEYGDSSHVESDAAIAARAAEKGSDGDGASAASAALPTDADAADGAPSRPGTAVRLLTLVFGAVFVTYTVGWIIGVGLVPLSGPTVVIEVMYQFSEFLAIVASPLWFAAVVSLTREGRAVHRLGWLALGTLVLLPWPIVLGVLA